MAVRAIQSIDPNYDARAELQTEVDDCVKLAAGKPVATAGERATTAPTTPAAQSGAWPSRRRASLGTAATSSTYSVTSSAARVATGS